jgi:hypothetical protein
VTKLSSAAVVEQLSAAAWKERLEAFDKLKKALPAQELGRRASCGVMDGWGWIVYTKLSAIRGSAFFMPFLCLLYAFFMPLRAGFCTLAVVNTNGPAVEASHVEAVVALAQDRTKQFKETNFQVRALTMAVTLAKAVIVPLELCCASICGNCNVLSSSSDTTVSPRL